MRYSELRAFHAVAQEGGFVRAAKRLNLSQPTLSSQVGLLEERYGVTLFERKGRRSEITELGRALFEITRRFFQVEQEADELLAAARGLKRGRLRLSADSPYLIMPAIAAFGRRHPGIAIEVTFGNSEAVLGRLLAREADLGVLPEVAGDRRLWSRPLAEGRLVLLVGRGHAWARRRNASLAELQGERLILRESGSKTQALFDRTLASAGLSLSSPWVVGSREGLREAVAEGLGIGVVMESEIGHDERIHALDLKDAPLRQTEYLACLGERREERVIAAFLGELG